MTFVVVVYVPDAVIMGADTRNWISATLGPPGEPGQATVETILTDTAQKVFVAPNQCGVATYGELLTPHGRLDQVLPGLLDKTVNARTGVKEMGEAILEALRRTVGALPTFLYVGGFDRERENEPVVLNISVQNGEIRRVNWHPQEQKPIFSCSWGGEGDIVDALLNGLTVSRPGMPPQNLPRFPVPFYLMSSEDAVAFADFAVRTTTQMIRFQLRKKVVGGIPQILQITPDGAVWRSTPPRAL
ncbi:MAG: hypothetical protein V2G42_00440 [bacterium JZ-2024 1]